MRFCNEWTKDAIISHCEHEGEYWKKRLELFRGAKLI
jgi:hypothetical protein